MKKTITSIWLFACLIARGQIPPSPGTTAPSKPTAPVLSPRAATAKPTGKAMALAIPATYYYRAFYNLSTNEAFTTGGAYGLYCSATNQNQNIFLGFAGEGVNRISFNGPLPVNPANLYVTYSAGGSNSEASPVVLLDTNLIMLSTNPAVPRVVNLRVQTFLAPPTNLTISISPPYPCITIQGTTNLHDYYPVGTTTNGLLTVICSQFEESYRARVDAANVMLTWTASISPQVTGYELIEYDMNTNIITSLTVSNVTSAIMMIHRPDKCVMFAGESLDEPDMEISFPSPFTFYKPTWPTVRISR